MTTKPCPHCERYETRALVAEDIVRNLRIENAALAREVSALADVRDGLLATLATIPQFARLASERLKAEQAAAIEAVQKVAGGLPG